MSTCAAADITGSWKLNLAKSKYGENYRIPKAQTTTWERVGAKLKLTQHEEFADPPSPIEGSAEYWIDGRESVNTIMGNKVISVAKAEGEDLVIESKSNFNGNDILLRDRWVLSSNNKTLTLNRHFEGMGRTSNQTIVFDKQ